MDNAAFKLPVWYQVSLAIAEAIVERREFTALTYSNGTPVRKGGAA